MALGDPYATLDAYKARVGLTDAVDDTTITAALDSASRSIESLTGRQFNLDSGLTTRVYYPTSQSVLLIDDIATATGLVIKTDNDDDGTYETTWTASDYLLEPINGVMDGVPGWPYCRIRAVGNKNFTVAGRQSYSTYAGPGPTINDYMNVLPLPSRRPSAQVTATYGWPVLPANVAQACLLLAAELVKLKDAPFGVAGFGEYGAVRVRENPKIAALLYRFTRNSIVFA